MVKREKLTYLMFISHILQDNQFYVKKWQNNLSNY